MSRKFVYYNSSRTVVQLLLDLYPAIVGYSVRQLSSSAVNCMRVRRSSDNNEQDFGFVGGELDTTSLLSFVGAGNGYVVKWYNQGTGGATYDAIQTSQSNQPLIVQNGSLITENGKPSIYFWNDILNNYTAGMLLPVTTAHLTSFSVIRVETQNTINYALSRQAGLTQGVIIRGSLSSVTGVGYYDWSNLYNSSYTENNNRQLIYFNFTDPNLFIASDGGAPENMGSTTQTNHGVNLVFGRTAGPVKLQGYGQEAIIYDTIQSANKTAIENDINTYYGIY